MVVELHNTTLSKDSLKEAVIVALNTVHHDKKQSVKASVDIQDLRFRTTIEKAAYKAYSREVWPRRLNFFPFTIPVVSKVILRLFNYFLKDQRFCDSLLIQSLYQLNESLSARIDKQQRHIDQLEQQIKAIKMLLPKNKNNNAVGSESR